MIPAAIKHNKAAPFWAVGLVLLCATGLSTNWIEFGPLWRGYVLDITGPAWNYILFRGLFTSYRENKWTRIFTPNNTVIIFIIVCFSIEIAQYYELYEATFDPWDFLAYVAALIPIYAIDKFLSGSSDNK